MKVIRMREKQMPENFDEKNDTQQKFELLNCPRNGLGCREHLSLINENYFKSYKYQRDKNYQKAIEALKCAYYTTRELRESTCMKCAKLFRMTITSSLEVMHKDLRIISTGMFSTKRFQSSYVEAENVLSEFRQEI